MTRKRGKEGGRKKGRRGRRGRDMYAPQFCLICLPVLSQMPCTFHFGPSLPLSMFLSQHAMPSSLFSWVEISPPSVTCFHAYSSKKPGRPLLSSCRIPLSGPENPLFVFLLSADFFLHPRWLSPCCPQTVSFMKAEAKSHPENTWLLGTLTSVSIIYLTATISFSAHPFCLSYRITFQLWPNHHWVEKWEFKLRSLSKAQVLSKMPCALPT